MTIRDDLGAENYEQLRNILKSAFHTGGGQPLSDATVDQAVRCLWENYKPEYGQLGVPPPPASFAPLQNALLASSDPRVLALYSGQATHSRTLVMQSDQPMQSKFTATLPMVRVSLPNSFDDPDELSLQTPIGVVYFKDDHLVGSVSAVNDKYSDAAHLGYSAARVDLITPARKEGARFGAVAIYLGYQNANDASPSFYILEAGLATGESKMIYFGKTLDTTITQPAYYEPTAYASVTDTFVGNIAVVGQDPTDLWVTSQGQTQSSPFIGVHVKLVPLNPADNKWPAELTFQAAARVALIGQVMHKPSHVPLPEVMAFIGKDFESWILPPKLL